MRLDRRKRLQVLSVSDARPGMLSACKQHCILCTVSYLLMECTFEKEGKTHTGDEREYELERELG
jgi:hypothetical protein